MFRGRTVLEVAAHRLWKFYSCMMFWSWRLTGLRRPFLSSKGQDRWIIKEVFPGLRGGYFIELGAGNGFTGSDTFVLEREHEWSGLCIEANPVMFEQLTTIVKRRCTCVEVCIDHHAGSADFVIYGDTSGIAAEDTDNSNRMRGSHLRRLRRRGAIQRVRTRSLAEVLDEHDSPTLIHYLSLDIEGAEERILTSFPFGRYRILALTVERPSATIHELLTAAGFILARYHWNDGFYLDESLSGSASVRARFRRKEF